MKTHHEWITQENTRQWLDMVCRMFKEHIKTSDPYYEWNDSDTAFHDSILMMIEDFFNRMDEDE